MKIIIIFFLGTILILSIFGCSKNPTSTEITIDINIPDDYPTIQEGINASSDGDVILVAPATYVENISYNGRNITIASMFYTTQDTSYISQTIIDGNNNDSVVKFENGEDATATLCGFTITNGYADRGGGIYCISASPILDNLTISCNTAIEAGGGIHCRNSSNPDLYNLTISDNASGDGGGLYCTNSNPSLENLTISGNTAIGQGGGIYSYYSNLILENVTITDNASDEGRGIFCQMSDLSLVNSILWNNSHPALYIHSGSVIVTYSDIEFSWPGAGNINSDPLFVNPAIGDYHLQPTSPCINAGDPLSPLDPDGTIADMGAFYFIN
ncbi:MAG: right-handed parallel beta-helix repeat-containing protein [Candidatus Cloacimonetes bacterium]|jgi:parallel beta-helix repeat protein/predicted outer membrane repeat protein|nr:right-handed parallel beta-helix repeat-containing protein [Candidatus Cloacimonadota bacterium]